MEPCGHLGHDEGVSALETISFRSAAIAVVALATLVHIQALGHAFTWNDGTNIVDNQALNDVDNIPAFFTQAWGAAAEDEAYRERNAQYWRPVPMALWTLEVALFGLNASVFHALNVLLHALTAWLLLLFAWRLWPRPGPTRAGLLLGVCAWAVHPVHTEVVHVVSYGSDLLAGLFTIACLALWLGDPERSEARSRIARWLWVPLLFALGVGSKEMAVTLPVLLVALDLAVSPGALTWSERALRVAPVGAVLVAYLLIRSALLGSGGQDFYAGAPASVVLFSMLDVLGLYARLLVIPWPLNPFYDWSALPPQQSLWAPGPLFGVCLLVGWCTLGLWLWRRRSRLCFAVALPLVVWIPVSHIVPIIIAAADRFLYVAAAGPLLLVAIMAARSQRSALWLPLIVGIIALHGSLSVVRGADWRDDRTILEASVRDWPTSFNAWYGLAALHAKEGRQAEAEAIWRRLGVQPSGGVAPHSE